MSKYEINEFVTHVGYGGKGKVLESDDTHSRVQWEVNAPPHVGVYYNTELRQFEEKQRDRVLDMSLALNGLYRQSQ